MTTRRLTLRVTGAQSGQRLDLVTHEWLQRALGRRLSKATVRRLIMAGIIRVDGRPSTRPGAGLAESSRLDASIDEGRLPAEDRTPAVDEVRVLFEDAALIAVAKPPGLQVHPAADTARADLFSLVRRYLGHAASAGGTAPPYLGLHHRLDRDTSGVVLFSKAPAANAGLAAQFEGRAVEKVYHALTTSGAGVNRGAWRVENQLGPVGKGRHARMAAVLEGGQPSVTGFSVLRRLRGALLVEARPETGRKHQIRAHLRESRLSILGDVRYDGPARLGSLVVPRPMLHARRLVLRHPLGGERLEIDCEYPADFRHVLDSLATSR